jgi:hypothetical protein
MKLGFKVIAMKVGAKILGLLLIVALGTAALPTGAFAVADHSSASSAALGQRPAGCHAHGGKSLPLSSLPHSPLPASYKCCLTGHDAAVVQVSALQQPPAQCTPVPPQIEPLLTGYFLGGLEVLMVPSADPPGTTPLRI